MLYLNYHLRVWRLPDGSVFYRGTASERQAERTGIMNAMLSDRLALAQRRRFGSSSEKYADGYFEVTETIEYKLTGEDRYCPDYGTKYKVVTKEVVKRLKFIPSTFEVVEEVTYVYPNVVL